MTDPAVADPVSKKGWGETKEGHSLDYIERLSRPKAKVPRRARQQENCVEALATAAQIHPVGPDTHHPWVPGHIPRGLAAHAMVTGCPH